MSSTSLSREEVLLLSDFDDDAYGLWEVAGSRQELVEHLVRAVQRGHLAVFSGAFGDPGEVLAIDAAVDAIRDPASWEFNEASQHLVSVMTTDSGYGALKQWVSENGFPSRS